MDDESTTVHNNVSEYYIRDVEMHELCAVEYNQFAYHSGIILLVLSGSEQIILNEEMEVHGSCFLRGSACRF